MNLVFFLHLEVKVNDDASERVFCENPIFIGSRYLGSNA